MSWRRRIPGALARRARRGPDANSGRTGSEAVFFWVQLVAAALAIAVILYGIAGTVAGWAGDVFEADSGGTIEVVLADVENQIERVATIGGTMVQTRATTPRVDLTVRNSGDSSVLLTEARITVEDSTWLPRCIVTGGGPVPVAGRYVVKLPFLPNDAERIVTKPLHDVVPPRGVDRFQLYFGLPGMSEDDNLYALHVELVTEAGQVVDGKRFVLGVPDPVGRAGYVLPEDSDVLHARPFHPNKLGSTWCFRHNLAGVRRVISRPGQRTADITALEHIRLADDWSAWADHRPARAAVTPLLSDPKLGYGPLLAAFAAERSGDAALLEGTRHRAAKLLLDRVEHALETDVYFAPSTAIEQLREALSLVPSSRGEELLTLAEARQREQEEEIEEQLLG